MKRFLAVMLTLTLLISSSAFCFASEGDNTGKLIGAPRDNTHYLETVNGDYKLVNTLRLTTDDLKNKSKVNATLSLALTGLGLFPPTSALTAAVAAGYAIATYADIHTVAGVYKMYSRTQKTYEVNRLTGKRALIETKMGVEIKIYEEDENSKLTLKDTVNYSV